MIMMIVQNEEDLLDIWRSRWIGHGLLSPLAPSGGDVSDEGASASASLILCVGHCLSLA